ncbi:hypothetical protein PRZ48_011688 [Zasmidium cellare]|uniref:Rad50/SbcC-type AAA domain-containing protein n=1 Tax=Zasmidium cellare TaxID=395010 RepID=A0ABR0E719_ZASCE|nr:hypothetical protein PRZ48_011688 [Zasmidium cellare]
MAQGKRTREDDDVDGDTEVEIESASSSFRQNVNNKRTKLALARERGGSVVSDDDDYAVDEYTGYDDLLEDEANSPMQDADLQSSLHISDDSDMDSSVDEIAATQLVEKQLRELKDNIASDEGIIEEITARNFMCHANLRIRLGPLINFIIGHNGSGKSAVLTALTMCLGGKANQTNRGANLKSMIKTGQETATLGVKIKNQGENAYKPDLYGDSITVERHFSRSGTSGFKIKNDQNKIVTHRRADLDDILDYFSLQLDNPINVLTQDMARSFLSNSSAADKYKFFLKGTQLETLDADYKLFELQLDNMNEKLRARDGDIELLAAKEKEALQRKKRADRGLALQDKLKAVQRQCAWLQVQQQEETLQSYEDEVEAVKESVQTRTEEAEDVSAAFEGHEQAVQAAQRKIEELQTHIGPAKERRDAAKEKFDNNKDELLKMTNDERKINSSLKSNKKEQNRLEKDIKDEQERLSGVHGDAHTKRLEEFDELKVAAEDAKQAHAEHVARWPDLESSRKDLVKQNEAAKAASATATQQARAIDDRLQKLQQSEGPWHAPYHPNMQRLVAEINRETRWRAKPVGPMGTKVHLNKPEWGSIIEKTCGGLLDGFAVTCKDDEEFLSAIARRVGMEHVQVFIANPRPIDTTGNEPEEGVDTILRVLKIDDDLVRNILIVNSSIEQVVLIADSRQARDYIGQDPRPANVRVSIGFGSQRGSGIRYERTRTGAQKSSPIHPWKGSTRMRTNREQQLAHEKRNLDDAKEEAGKAEENARAVLSELTKAKQALERHRREEQRLKTKMQEDEDAVEGKQAEIDSNRPEDGKLQELERLLEETKANLQNDKDQYRDTVQEKEKFAGLGAELKRNLGAVEEELNHATGRVETAEQQLKDVEEARVAALMEKNEALERVKTAENHVTRLEKKRDEQKAKVEEWTQLAEQVASRIAVEPGVTMEALEERMATFKRLQREEEARAGGSREELAVLHGAAHDAWMNAKKERDDLVKVAKMLQDTLKLRQFRWQQFKRLISARARITFQYLLSERRYRGRVLLSHDDKTLDISVEPDITKLSDSGRQAKTLSGGEKSFSTICLLLSIWEAMGSPIRCLDEFDVFMDSVNRAQSMQMMIQTARRSVGRQFILITPQSMNNVTLGDDVKIHK